MTSTTTTVIPVRVGNDMLARLDALAARLTAGNRTELVRQALRSGLEALESHSQAGGKGKRQAGPRKPRQAASVELAPVQGTQAPPAGPETEAPALLQSFAHWVMDSAKRTSTGRYGDDRIFVSHVFRQFKRDQRPRGLTLESFKDRLIEANSAGFLSLVRADMAPLLSEKDVKESEIAYLSTTFHLLCL